jgi:hypothetical protein
MTQIGSAFSAMVLQRCIASRWRSADGPPLRERRRSTVLNALKFAEVEQVARWRLEHCPSAKHLIPAIGELSKNGACIGTVFL